MTPIKLNRPPSSTPVDRVRYDEQLARRGVVDQNKDGVIDSKDGIDPAVMKSLRAAANADPTGMRNALDPSEIQRMPIQRSIIDKARDLVGLATKEQNATETVQQAVEAVRKASYWVDDLVIWLDRFAASPSERESERATDGLLTMARALNDAAAELEEAVERSTIGLADAPAVGALQDHVERLARALTELRGRSLVTGGGNVGPYWAISCGTYPRALSGCG